MTISFVLSLTRAVYTKENNEFYEVNYDTANNNIDKFCNNSDLSNCSFGDDDKNIQKTIIRQNRNYTERRST